MRDHDFVLFVSGDQATLSTHRWTATQWLREKAPDLIGKVIGANYATITGNAKDLVEIAARMEDAGLIGAASSAGRPREGKS